MVTCRFVCDTLSCKPTPVNKISENEEKATSGSEKRQLVQNGEKWSTEIPLTPLFQLHSVDL
jgi:hypothetical protein